MFVSSFSRGSFTHTAGHSLITAGIEEGNVPTLIKITVTLSTPPFSFAASISVCTATSRLAAFRTLSQMASSFTMRVSPSLHSKTTSPSLTSNEVRSNSTAVCTPTARMTMPRNMGFNSFSSLTPAKAAAEWSPVIWRISSFRIRYKRLSPACSDNITPGFSGSQQTPTKVDPVPLQPRSSDRLKIHAEASLTARESHALMAFSANGRSGLKRFSMVDTASTAA